MTRTVLIPIPSTDFDPTEVAVPWQLLKAAGVEVRFATPGGGEAQCDLRMLNGKGLGFLAPLLIADKNGREAYEELQQSTEFKNPIAWEEIKPSEYDGIILPGGHAKGMKEYLESTTLQRVVAEFFSANKLVGAICHGVVLAHRSQVNGVSILEGRKTTALLKTQELLAWVLTFLWLGNYYRTYAQTVEDEVRGSLAEPEHFLKGPMPLWRDSKDHLERGFVVRDGNYISARWPGDAHRFATEFLKAIKI